MKKEFLNYIDQLQEKITASLEHIDGKSKFREDVWDRPEGWWWLIKSFRER